MFKIFGTEEPSDEADEIDDRTRPNMALLALADPAIPDPEMFMLCLRSSWTGGPAPDIKLVRQESLVLTFSVGPAMVSIGLVQKPIPREEVESAIEMAWHWPGAGEALQFHTAHLLIGMDWEEDDRVLMAMKLTRIISAIAQIMPLKAVHWTAGPVLQSPEAFIELARSMSIDQLPLTLWVSFGILPETDGTHTMITSGMRALEFLEIEIVRSTQPVPMIAGIAFGTAHHMLIHGVVLKDGSDLGLNLRQAPSILSEETTVIRIETDATPAVDSPHEQQPQAS